MRIRRAELCPSYTIHDTNIDTRKLLAYLPHLLKQLFDHLHATVSDQDVAQLSSDIETALKANPVPPDSANLPGLSPFHSDESVPDAILSPNEVL